jgi:HPt (histidine-containing phosphotransfer) domain-containing protein
MTALVMKGDRERCIASERVDFAPALDTTKDLFIITAELLERLDGDRAFLSELLELFREEYPGQIRRAREAANTGDAATLQRIGHTLKGALANLAAPVCSGLAGQLESMGRTGNMQAAVATVKELEQELDRAIEILEGICMETAH